MRHMVICSLALSLFFGLGCGKKKPQYHGPHISFEVAKVDFGIMDQESEATKEILFENTGNQVLEIKDVKSSCGCTAALPSDRIIDPGEKGILTVTFKSGKSMGDVEKVVTIITNDSVKPETRLPVKAHVKTDITMEPRTLDFGDVKLGQEAFAEAKLVAENGQPFKITYVEADTASFTYTLSPIDEGGKPGYLFKVGLKNPRKPQSFYKPINLRTDNPRCQLFHLPVVANVLGNVKIEPRSVMLQGVAGSGRLTKTVSVTALGDATVRVLGAECTKGLVNVETKTIEEGRKYEILVSHEAASAGRQRDFIVIKTDDEYESEVRISVNIVLTEERAVSKTPAAAGAEKAQ